MGMRRLLISITSMIWLCFVMSARAEQDIFVVANDPDGYGIDRCLASGAKCGTVAANAYCKMQDFAAAATFHKINSAEITGSIKDASVGACAQASCVLVAIICTR